MSRSNNAAAAAGATVRNSWEISLAGPAQTAFTRKVQKLIYELLVILVLGWVFQLAAIIFDLLSVVLKIHPPQIIVGLVMSTVGAIGMAVPYFRLPAPKPAPQRDAEEDDDSFRITGTAFTAPPGWPRSCPEEQEAQTAAGYQSDFNVTLDGVRYQPEAEQAANPSPGPEPDLAHRSHFWYAVVFCVSLLSTSASMLTLGPLHILLSRKATDEQVKPRDPNMGNMTMAAGIASAAAGLLLGIATVWMACSLIKHSGLLHRLVRLFKKLRPAQEGGEC